MSHLAFFSFQNTQNGSTAMNKILKHRENYTFAPSMRRCGKSITLALLKAMVEGNRDALDGMAICGEASTWSLPSEGTYTVISLDFSKISTSDSFGSTDMRIAEYLAVSAMLVGITIPENVRSPATILDFRIQQAAGGRHNNVIVLIDEYDAILTPFLIHPEKLEKNSAALKEAFVSLKAANNYRFKAFVTGGLKAGMAGSFSGANNFYRLVDMEAEYATIFGFTEEQILETYAEHIKEFFPRIFFERFTWAQIPSETNVERLPLRSALASSSACLCFAEVQSLFRPSEL